MGTTARFSRSEEAARRFHELTTVLYREDGSEIPRKDPLLLSGFKELDPDNEPDPFKRFLGAAEIALPTDFAETSVRAVDLLSGSVECIPTPFSLESLARLLFFSAGVTRVFTPKSGGRSRYLRACASAGALHPIELYVVSDDRPGLAAGVYHFTPLPFSLEELRLGDFRSFLASAIDDEAALEASAFLILTGIPFRTAWKYTERGYRHVFWDAGTMLANTLAMVDASGWKASVRLAFSDSHVTALLGLQDQFEVPLVVVAIRAPGSDRAERAETAIPPLAMSTTPVAARPVVFPLVIETQAAGDLDQSDVGSWREAAAKVGSPATTRTIAAPEQTSNEIIESLILRRGSTRMMRRQTVPLEVLRWVMSIATRPIPGDFAASEATLLNYHLAVYDVEATESGFYEWSGGELRMSRAEDSATVRAETQPLIAFWGDDAAYSLYECADLDELLPALGARGYRAAQVEAGIVAGRVNLAAFSLGYGSTPLTVRDRFVADVFGTKANFMLTMVVGTPGYSNVSGGKPGKPVELSGLEGLIDRLIDHIRKSRDP